MANEIFPKSPSIIPLCFLLAMCHDYFLNIVEEEEEGTKDEEEREHMRGERIGENAQNKATLLIILLITCCVIL